MNKEKICISDKLEQSRCTGCGACINCCSVDALSFGRDPWGYYIPVVDKEKCVGCGKCISTCPVYSNTENRHFELPQSYAFINGNMEELNTSSSGGVFTRLAQAVFAEKGIVYGAAWNKTLREDHLVCHKAVETETEFQILKKSKYLQSYIGYTFREIKEKLKKGQRVLFSGCPCQVAGLRTFLGNEYINLICIDILCAFSPSEQFFRDYIVDNFGNNIVEYEFRHKENNWRCDSICVTTKDGMKSVITGNQNDDFQSVYHDHTMCPPHCENCCFHSFPRVGDITIGDFWGIMRKDPAVPGQNGVSVVLINSPKGKGFFENIYMNETDYIRQVPLDWIGGNGYTGKNSRNYASPYRDEFYEDIQRIGFSGAVGRVERIKNRQEIQRYRGCVEMLLNWMMRTNEEDALVKSIQDKGYRKIAIYGMGDLGKLLYKRLKLSPVEVAYAIDRNPPRIDDQLKILSLNSDLLPVDAIIVTIIWEFESIRKKLENRIDTTIISMQEL